VHCRCSFFFQRTISSGAFIAPRRLTMQETRLEHLVERGRAATGRAAADLIEEATSAPGMLVFGELLELEGVKALATDPTLAGYFALLQIFSHGTLPEYRAWCVDGKSPKLPPLTPVQELKLKKLTVASLAENASVLSYDDLTRALEITTVRDLEDLLIDECIPDNVVKGKLDQKKNRFEVHSSMARDLRPGQLGELITELENWRDDVRRVLKGVDENAKISKEASAKEKERAAKTDELIDAATRNIKSEVDAARGSVRGPGAHLEEDDEGMDMMDADDVRSGIGSKRRR